MTQKQQPGKKKMWKKNSPMFLMYVASALGALSKSFFDAVVSGHEFHVSLEAMIFSFVVAAVTFPLIFEIVKKTQKNMEGPTLLIYFMVYQSGFFWQSMLAHIVTI